MHRIRLSKHNLWYFALYEYSIFTVSKENNLHVTRQCDAFIENEVPGLH